MSDIEIYNIHMLASMRNMTVDEVLVSLKEESIQKKKEEEAKRKEEEQRLEDIERRKRISEYFKEKTYNKIEI